MSQTLFLVLMITPKVYGEGLRAVVACYWPFQGGDIFMCNSYLMCFGVGISCRILYSSVGYLYVCGGGSISSVREERELICLLLCACNYVVSVWRGFSSSGCLGWAALFYSIPYKSRVMRKPTFCICENKDADQLRGKREADQRLCFCYTNSTIPLLPKSEISSL